MGEINLFQVDLFCANIDGFIIMGVRHVRVHSHVDHFCADIYNISLYTTSRFVSGFRCSKFIIMGVRHVIVHCHVDHFCADIYGSDCLDKNVATMILFCKSCREEASH